MARKKSRRRPTPKKPKRRQTVNVRATLEKAVRVNPEDIESRLCLGEWYLRNGREESILDAVEPIEKDYPLESVDSRVAYNCLRGYGLTHTGRYVEAEQVIRRLMADALGSLDAFYLLAYVHLAMREYDQAADAARQYLSLYADQAEEPSNRSYSNTAAHLSQVHNTLGSVHQDRGVLSEAIRAYDDAIKADRRNHLPYLNLARLYERQDRLESAREVVQRGMQYCSQIQELHLLAKSLERGATVSACMIVKNEEELLPDCLASIRDWVDEIIVVDTGSTDKTVEIAESYGAQIFHQEWEGNFSKHRNYSLNQATKDWIFIIDADERFLQDDLQIIRRHMNDGKHRAVALNVFNYSGKHDERVTSLASVRLFKRELGLKYEGIVHNQLVIDPEEPIAHTKARIKHLGYGLSEEQMAAKAQRTIVLLKKQLEENPDHAFAHFNYAQVLLGQDLAKHPENPPRIIEAATRAVELTDPHKGSRSDRHVHLMALEQMAMTHFIIGEDSTGEKYALRALNIKPDYLDPILLLGNIYLRRNSFEEAEQYFNRYLETQARVADTVGAEEMMLMHPRSFQHAHYGLGLVAEHRRDWSAAVRHLEKALAHSPELLDANAHLGRVQLEQKQYNEAEKLFRKQLEIDGSSHRAAVGLACVYSATQRKDEADTWLSNALDMLPKDHPALIEYALMLDQAGLTGQATIFIDKMAVSEALTSESQSKLAECCFKLGKYDRAAEIYELLVQNETEDPALLNDLAGCYYKMEVFTRAEELYQKATLLPEVPDVAFRNLGLARIQLDRHEDAIVPLEEYLELTPEQPEIVRLLADLHLQANDFSRALTLYELCLQSNATDAGALYGLSECYLHMGHKDSAIMGYERVLQLNPEFTPAKERLAQVREMVEKS